MGEHQHRFMTMAAPDGYTDEMCATCPAVRWSDRPEYSRNRIIALENRVEELESAIRIHREQPGIKYSADEWLYEALGEEVTR